LGFRFSFRRIRERNLGAAGAGRSRTVTTPGGLFSCCLAGEPATGLADFYRKIWKQGEAGTNVPLDILGDGGLKRVDIKSINRNDHLRLKTTF
jgi:hypothetical protein